MARIPWIILVTSLFLSIAGGQVSESLKRHENSDIAKLAALTHADHSTIFWVGLADSGYIRDGQVHSVVLDPGAQRADCNYCMEQSVSRDGLRIAYATAANGPGGCRIVIRDLRTDMERDLSVMDRSHALIWSPDDTEIFYQDPDGIFAVSVADGSKRRLDPPPLRNDPRAPALFGWSPRHNSDVIWTVGSGEDRVFFSSDGSRSVEIRDAEEVALSPVDDRIAYIVHDGRVLIVDTDGSNRRAITRITSALPFMSFLPFLKEYNWTRIVWSPNGDRFWFGTLVAEGGQTNLYLVNVQSGRRERVLKHTSLTITNWREAFPLPIR